MTSKLTTAFAFLLILGFGIQAKYLHEHIGKKSVSPGELLMNTKVKKSEKEWKRELTPEQFHILRKSGTERAFTGKYNDHTEKGMYICAGCGKPLFTSNNKYLIFYDQPRESPKFRKTLNFPNILHKLRTNDTIHGKGVTISCEERRVLTFTFLSVRIRVDLKDVSDQNVYGVPLRYPYQKGPN